MIDIEHEQLITRSEAARLLTPRNGRKMHVGSIYRWMIAGKRGVRLESTTLGKERLTSVEAVQRFSDQLNNRLTPRNSPAAPHRKQHRESPAHLRSMAQLEAMGLV